LVTGNRTLASVLLGSCFKNRAGLHYSGALLSPEQNHIVISKHVLRNTMKYHDLLVTKVISGKPIGCGYRNQETYASASRLIEAYS
jgi:hypothetical protein